jgi:hypothetical protein
VSDERDLPEINPDEAMTRLDAGLETCRSVLADYRAALIAAGGDPDQRPADQVPPAAPSEQH